jgi:hypothetical protein
MKIESNLPPEELLRRADLALGFAGMLDGRTREAKELKARGKAMERAAWDAKFGPLPENNMTADELLAELLA